MKFSTIFVLGLAGFVAAKGNKNDATNSTGTSTKSQCKQVSKLTKITDLAANSTKLADKLKNNATKIAEFQAKAATATTELDTLKANTTLMDSCNVIFAQEDMVQSCDKMVEIEKANQIINNATLLAKVTDNNATKADEFKAKVAAKSTELSALQSNTTLTDFCSGLQTKDTCKSMAKLAKEQALAANTTALSAKLNGDADKISKFQAKVQKKVAAMADMMTNTTLIDACKSYNITLSAAATSTDSKSAGVSVQALAGGQIFALVGAFVYALTML
ncbi:hypothetical protein N0V82_008738 [Gnomoniopsis sp. IMI 355080]|nr:hypothetical protein N0V82_008738 [Gnomoniopsis sp. IMI 355080]